MTPKLSNTTRFVFPTMAILIIFFICAFIFEVETKQKAEQVENADKEAEKIFGAYVSLAEEEDGLSEIAQINMEAELIELGYDEVEAVLPKEGTTGEYPIVVVLYKYNSSDSISSTKVLSETILVE